MQEKILFVDDDANLLEGFQRQLRKQFSIETALGGEQALAAICSRGPFAVVVADMRMPSMDGIQLLRKVRAVAPDTVRMMLTGNADQQTAIDAVNEGSIFRFLTKPCPQEALTRALRAGIEQYRLIVAEKELLEKTLIGSIKVLTEILSLSDPQAFGRALKLKKYAQEVAGFLGYEEVWELQMAAMLVRIGHVVIPAEITRRAQDGCCLSEQEMEMLARVPEISRDLLVRIPRLEPVAEIVYYHERRYAEAASHAYPLVDAQIPRGARILKILTDLIEIEAVGTSRTAAFRILRTRNGWYDPEILNALNAYFAPNPAGSNEAEASEGMEEAPPISGETIFSNELQVGDMLLADIETGEGTLLLAAGHVVTELSLEKLRNYFSLGASLEHPTLLVRPNT